MAQQYLGKLCIVQIARSRIKDIEDFRNLSYEAAWSQSHSHNHWDDWDDEKFYVSFVFEDLLAEIRFIQWLSDRLGVRGVSRFGCYPSELKAVLNDRHN